MKRFVKKHSSFLLWVFLPSLILMASVMGVNLVSRPGISNPFDSCSIDAQCTDSAGCYSEVCDTNNSFCVRTGVDTSAAQTCFQCGSCGNAICEQDLENSASCPADCVFDFSFPQDMCEVSGNNTLIPPFGACGTVANRCCPTGCQGTNPQDSTFDADCCNGCGDNLISGTETCDGTAVKTGLTPPSGNNTCRAPASAGECTYCGDGAVDGAAGEQCDPPNGTTCGATCLLLTCGDGIVTAPEECDPQNTSTPCAPGLTCSPTTCQCTGCGDGVITPPEECEPPNSGNCDANCQLIQVCGNGIVEVGEECEGTTCTATINGEAIPGVCNACQCIPECQMEGSGCGDDGTGNIGVCFAGTGGTGVGNSLIPIGVRVSVLAQWLATFAIPGAAFVGLKIRRRFKK